MAQQSPGEILIALQYMIDAMAATILALPFRMNGTSLNGLKNLKNKE